MKIYPIFIDSDSKKSFLMTAKNTDYKYLLNSYKYMFIYTVIYAHMDFKILTCLLFILSTLLNILKLKARTNTEYPIHYVHVYPSFKVINRQ